MTPGPPAGVPFDTASIRPKAGTTAPAGGTPTLSSPPALPLTFWAEAGAYSGKMSLVGHVLCQRIVIGPCDLAAMGKPRVAAAAPPAATAAALRTSRRETRLGWSCRSTFGSLMPPPLG